MSHPDEQARLVRAHLEDLLSASLSTNVQAQIACHLERHGSLEHENAEREALVALIQHEARANTLHAWASSLAKTALVTVFIHLVFGKVLALAAALPLFIVIHRMRVRRGHVRRALALAAASDQTPGLANEADQG
jgi:hypothetical protein